MSYKKLEGLVLSRAQAADAIFPTHSFRDLSRPVPNLAVLEHHLSGLNFAESLDVIARQAMAFTPADGTAIAIVEPGAVVCRARAGTLAPPLGSLISVQSGICGTCLTTGEVMNCTNTEMDPRVNVEACRQLGIHSILAIPLIDDSTFGVLAVFSREARAFGEHEMEVMLMLSGLIGKPETQGWTASDESQRLKSNGNTESTVRLQPSISGPVKALRPATEKQVTEASRCSVQSSSRHIASKLETIRQDAALQLLVRVKAYLRIESIYDGDSRSEALDLCEKLLLLRAADLGVTLPTSQ